MKISQDKYNALKKTGAKTPIESNSKLNELIRMLIKAVKDNKIDINSKDIADMITNSNDSDPSRMDNLINYLGEKLDIMTKAIKSRPTSFEFDVKRNATGYISKVLVRPNK